MGGAGPAASFCLGLAGAGTACAGGAAQLPPPDPELGAYLAAECVTCHKQGGGDLGVPSITHWPEAEFTRALDAYRGRERPHAVMQMIAARLSDADIRALAAYFAGLPAPALEAKP